MHEADVKHGKMCVNVVWLVWSNWMSNGCKTTVTYLKTLNA